MMYSITVILFCVFYVFVDSKLVNENYYLNQVKLNDYNEYIASFSGKSLNNDTKVYSKVFIYNNETNQKSFNSIFDYYLTSFSNLILLTTSKNEICKNQTVAFLNSLQKLDMWALEMFDSSAKIPSGILSGNMNQYGDYDQCLSVRGSLDSQSYPWAEEDVYGKYCLAYIDFRLDRHNPYFKHIDSLIHSYDAFKSNFEDPGHRVPRFSATSWGVCIPSGCSSEDLQEALFAQLEKSVPNVRVRVESAMCVTKKTNKDVSNISIADTNIGASVAKWIFLTLFLVTIISSSFDFFNINVSKNNKILQAFNIFSLPENLTRLMSPSKPDASSLRSLHGIRCLNAISLLISHKSMALLYNPYINRTSMAYTLGMAWSVIGRTAIIYTDSFILLSGLLITNTLLKELDKSGSINFRSKVIGRIFRILPNLIAVILFCTYYLPYLGSGPLWPLVIQEHANICKKNMWRNFVLIHNYFGFENMCLTHTHQVGLDMQLFLMSPIFVLILWNILKSQDSNSSKKAWGFLILAGIVSTILRIYASYAYKISTVVYFGMPVRKLFDTADFSYILPLHRITIYGMGIGLAFILRSVKLNLSKLQVTLCWITAVTLGVLAQQGPYAMSRLGYIYQESHAALYTALSPIAWGIFISWIIYASNNGYGGWFGDFLSWKGFDYFTKIAYAVYLTQFPVFFYNVGTQRSVQYYKPSMMFEIGEVLFILFISTVLTVFVEIPFQRLYSTLYNTGLKKTAVQKKDVNNNECSIEQKKKVS